MNPNKESSEKCSLLGRDLPLSNDERCSSSSSSTTWLKILGVALLFVVGVITTFHKTNDEVQNKSGHSPATKSESSSPWCKNSNHPAQPAMYGIRSSKVDLVGPKGSQGQHIDLPSDDMVTVELFRQGLTHLWGFNNNEALRNFQTATDRSPSCALCWWGVAASFSPNINYAIERQDKLNDAIKKAMNLAKEQMNLTKKSKTLIESFGKLVVNDPSLLDHPASPARLAWAESLCSESVDEDVDTLCAAAIMSNSAWSYYQGTAAGITVPMKPELEPAMNSLLSIVNNTITTTTPHVLAIHLLIHLLEPANAPPFYRYLALPAAQSLSNRTLGLSPTQGHLTHMPAHLFLRTGNYHEGVISSEQAIADNVRYLKHCLKPYAHAHNVKMLVAHARLGGMSQKAMFWSRELAKNEETMGAQLTPGGVLACLDCAGEGDAHAIMNLVRWGGRWEEVLEEPQPKSWGHPDFASLNEASFRMARAVSFYSLAAAGSEVFDEDLVRKGDEEAKHSIRAGSEAVSEENIMDASGYFEPELNAMRAWKIEKNFTKAIDNMRKVVDFDDSVSYIEPPTWYYPPRHCLGAMLVEKARMELSNDDDAREALDVFQRDLFFNPNNAWSLNGVADSMELLGRSEEANAFRQKAEVAWKHSDLDFVSPCPQFF